MFGKKHAPKQECTSCGRALIGGRKVCACGAPTPFMTFEERTQYEVQRWREHLDRAATA
jgi:hypothetical protein